MRKFIFALLCGLLCFLPTVKLQAAPDYNVLMSSIFSTYFSPAQPDTALVLSSNITLNRSHLSTNYGNGVFDLPRLKYGYHYLVFGLDNNNNFVQSNIARIGNSLYPTLVLTQNVQRTSQIKLALVIVPDSNASNKNLGALNHYGGTAPNVNDWNKTPSEYQSGAYTTILLDDDFTGVSNFEDCSSVSSMLQTNSVNTSYLQYSKTVQQYPAVLHKYAIVMPKYVIVGSDYDMTSATAFFAGLLPEDITSQMYIADGYDFSAANKYFGDNRPILANVLGSVGSGTALMYGNYPSAVYDPHYYGFTYTGNNITTTRVKNTDVIGYGFLCWDDGFIAEAVKNSNLGTIKNVPVSDSAVVLEMNTGTPMDVTGYDTVPYYEAFLENYTGIFSSPKWGSIRYDSGLVNTFNLYRDSIIAGGFFKNVASLHTQSLLDSATINYWKVEPETETKTIIKTELREKSRYTPFEATMPEYDGYTFTNWFTSPDGDTVADPQTMLDAIQSGDTIDIYGLYEYTGGYYDAVLIDRNPTNGAVVQKTTTAYRILDDPDFWNPTRTYAGYKFHSWRKVENDLVAAKVEDPMFYQNGQHTMGVTEYYSSFYDILGIITSVSVNKQTYNVNETLDKTQFVVYIQRSSSTDPVIASTSEYTISPTKFSSTGNKTVTVTYSATGAQHTVTITVKKNGIKSITAEYEGNDLEVDAEIDKDDIKVKAKYEDGSEKTLSKSDFSIDPSKIKDTGKNKITVKVDGEEDTIYITGKSKDSRSSDTEKAKVRSLSATYTGGTPKVGGIVQPRDFTVIGNYSDNTSSRLGISTYSVTPNTFVKGLNSFLISYENLNTTVNVNCEDEEEKKQATTASSGNNNNSSNNKNNNNNNTTSNSTDNSTSSGSSVVDAVARGKEGKGTSTGYMSGASVLSGGLSSANGTQVAEVNLEGVVDNAIGITANADLYNEAAGNFINTAVLTKLRDKGMLLTIDIRDSKGTRQIIARWIIDGSKLSEEDITKEFDLNVKKTRVNRSGSETMTVIYPTANTFPASAELEYAILQGEYNYNEELQIYNCSRYNTDSKHVSTMNAPATGSMITFPLHESEAVAIINSKDIYPDGSDLSRALTPTSEETEEEEEVVEEEVPFDFWDDTEDPSLEPEPEPAAKPGLPIIPILIGAGVILLLGGGAVAFFIIKKRSSSPSSDVLEEADPDDLD